MFHANAWGLPYARGARGRRSDPARTASCGAEPLARLIEAERPTLMALRADDLRRPAALRRRAPRRRPDARCERRVRRLGDAAPADAGLPGAPRRAHPPGVGHDRDEPRGDVSRPPEGHGEPDDATGRIARQQGRPLPCVELRLVDDDGQEVPWDGAATGEIEVRGPWIAAGYFREDVTDEKFDDGLAAHRRHRLGRRERLRADHRPLEGRDQVRRRVDLLGRARERADGAPGRGARRR